MKRLILLMILFSVCLLPGCTSGRYTTTVVKPKYQKGFFDRKKDKGKKRTKTVRVRN